MPRLSLLLLLGLPGTWLAAEDRRADKDANVLFAEGFDDADLLKRGWYDGSKFRISPKNPRSGAGCIEYHWPDKATTPDSSSGIRRLLEPTEEVHVRFYLKLSPTFGWTGVGYHPHFMHFLTTENPKFHGPASSHLTLYIEPHNGKLRLAATDMQNAAAPHGLTQGPLKGGYNGTMYDSNDLPFKDGNWHCVEAMFRLNSLDLRNDTPGRDGVARGWFDGRLVIERTDLVFRTTDFPRMKLNQFLMLPYFGPGLLPHEQTLWVDELVVSTRRVGPVPDQGTRGTSARPRSAPATTGKAPDG